jgi:hypothetical protein
MRTDGFYEDDDKWEDEEDEFKNIDEDSMESEEPDYFEKDQDEGNIPPSISALGVFVPFICY